MRLTKDEAWILSEALGDAKYEFETRSIDNLFEKLLDLETRLQEFGEDKRRNGRTSMNGFHDCMKRYAHPRNS